MAEQAKDINQRINEAVDAYFESHADIQQFSAKKIMPDLVKNGVFIRDIKNGMPLRQVLRALDIQGELELVPRAYAERIGADIYWYFVREGSEYISNHVSDVPNAKERKAIERTESDETYLIVLIDELLNQSGARKQTFDFLLGDIHQNGKTRTELPLDLYYRELKLAIEFVEHPESAKAKHDPKQEKLTVSGISRAEQRIKYLNRKKKVLAKKEMHFVEIPLIAFDLNDSFKLIRSKENDERVLRGLLSEFMD